MNAVGEKRMDDLMGNRKCHAGPGNGGVVDDRTSTRYVWDKNGVSLIPTPLLDIHRNDFSYVADRSEDGQSLYRIFWHVMKFVERLETLTSLREHRRPRVNEAASRLDEGEYIGI